MKYTTIAHSIQISTLEIIKRSRLLFLLRAVANGCSYNYLFFHVIVCTMWKSSSRLRHVGNNLFFLSFFPHCGLRQNRRQSLWDRRRAVICPGRGWCWLTPFRLKRGSFNFTQQQWRRGAWEKLPSVVNFCISINTIHINVKQHSQSTPILWLHYIYSSALKTKVILGLKWTYE